MALLAICGLLPWATPAHASSEGAIILTPSIGAAGTQVSADVRIFAPPVQDFVLKATTTAPEQGGCASAVAIPGAPTFSAGGPAGGQAAFSWPANLPTNMYWLCAFPTAGGPDQAHTGLPFIVTKEGAPAFNVTPDLALAGSTLKVAFADWLAPDHQAPAQLWIVTPDGNTRILALFQVLTPPDGAGACTLSFALPNTITSGTFFLVAGSTAYYRRSDTFSVEAPEIATAIAVMNASPTPSTAPTQVVAKAPSTSALSDNTPLVLALSAGGLLLLVVGGVALRVVRRRA